MSGALVEQFCEKMTAWGARFIVDTQCTRFRHPALAEALEVWRRQADPQGVVARRAMTPKILQPFITKTALFERIDQPLGAYRWRARVTGQEFTLAYAEMSGKFLDEVLPPKYLLRWRSLGDLVLACGGPVRYLTVTEAFHRENSVLEHLFVPLADDAGKLSQLLLVCHFERGAEWKTVVAEEAGFGHRACGPEPQT